MRSRTFAAGLNPALSSASGVSSATWWQAARGRLESLLAVKLVMADLGTAGFKVVGDLVIIMCGRDERLSTSIVLPCPLGQLPQMVRSLAVVRNVGHVWETARSD